MSDPTRVLVAGDWHGSTSWAYSVIRRLPDLLPEESPRMIVHLGDFGVWPGHAGAKYLRKLDMLLERYGAVLWFVDGNHEWHDKLDDLPRHNGMGQVSDRIWHLPRGHRWTWHDRTWLALGGAVSVDRALRDEGVSWWRQEQITADQARQAAEAGTADVMVCHDAPTNVPFDLPPASPSWDKRDLQQATAHREILQGVMDKVQPSYLLHGHYHLAQQVDVNMQYGSCQVTGLNCDGAEGNWRVLDVKTMSWDAHP